MNGKSAPVSTGEIHEVEIQSVGGKGDGIARVKGFVIFVPGVQKGDYVKIKITKVLEKVGFAEVVGKAEKPAGGIPRESKFATFTQEEVQRQEPEQQHYNDTEDFGEES